jgi:hypothetical protein
MRFHKVVLLASTIVLPLPGGLLAADLQSGASASSGISGYVEGSGLIGRSKKFDVDEKAWSLRGALNYDAGNGINLQVDGGVQRSHIEDHYYTPYSAAAHLYYRPANAYAIGGFVKYDRVATGMFGNLGIVGVGDYTKEVSGGLEAAAYMDNTTFYGLAGYGRQDYAIGDADHYFGGIGARYFLTDNLRLDLEGMYHHIDGIQSDMDIGTIKTAVNYRMDSMPLTVFAGYRFDNYHPTSSLTDLSDDHSHTFFAGLRYSFGSQSLKDEDRNGPAWSSTSILP